MKQKFLLWLLHYTKSKLGRTLHCAFGVISRRTEELPFVSRSSANVAPLTLQTRLPIHPPRELRGGAQVGRKHSNSVWRVYKCAKEQGRARGSQNRPPGGALLPGTWLRGVSGWNLMCHAPCPSSLNPNRGLSSRAQGGSYILQRNCVRLPGGGHRGRY